MISLNVVCEMLGLAFFMKTSLKVLATIALTIFFPVVIYFFASLLIAFGIGTLVKDYFTKFYYKVNEFLMFLRSDYNSNGSTYLSSHLITIGKRNVVVRLVMRTT